MQPPVGDGWPRPFDYDDISIAPRVASTLLHRSEARPEVDLGPLRLSLPLIASPMPDVCGAAMARTLAREGALGIVHRFQAIAAEVAEFECAARELPGEVKAVGAAVGVTGDYLERCQRSTGQAAASSASTPRTAPTSRWPGRWTASGPSSRTRS
jgi:hypothetical protein